MATQKEQPPMTCPVVLMALLSAMSMGDTIWAPGYLPMCKPSDTSTEGDVLIRVDGSVTGHVPAALGAASVQPWVVLSIPWEGGSGGAAFLITAGSWGPPACHPLSRAPWH